jgi:Protein of unknown function, DUF547
MASEPSLVELSQRTLSLARSLGDGSSPVELDRVLDKLASSDPTSIQGDASRIAVWLNLYNARLLHALALRTRHGHLIRHRRMFRRAAYVVGSLPYSLDAMEHGVLRRNRRPPVSLRRVLGRADSRLAAAPSSVDPRIHFALNCGAASCPPIHSYASLELDRQLSTATRSYFASEARVDRARMTLMLPALIRLYRGDFGNRVDQLEFASRHLASEDAEWLRRNEAGVRIRYGRFDWTIDPSSAATPIATQPPS